MKPLRFMFSIPLAMATVALTWFTMVLAQETSADKAVEKAPGKQPVAVEPQSGRVEQGGAPSATPAASPQKQGFIYQSVTGEVPHLIVRGVPGAVDAAVSARVAEFPPAGAALPQSQEDIELGMKSHDLMAKLKETTDEPERKSLIADLTVLVTNHFNIRQRQRDQELRQLEDQLKKLRAIQDKREAVRAEIIAERVSQLVRESQGLNWGVDPIGAQFTGIRSSESVNVGGKRSAYIAEVPAHATNVAPRSLAGWAKMPGPTAAPPVEEVRIFKLSAADDAELMLKTVETLIGSGPLRAQFEMTTMGNKIVARGQVNALKTLEVMIQKLQDDVKEAK